MKAAVATLGRAASPRVLIVDVSGEADPMRALDSLAAVAEPSTAVLVIGEVQDMDFYREVTRGAGVAEYLAKPLVRDRVARLFGPVVRGQAYDAAPVNGGRSISVTGGQWRGGGHDPGGEPRLAPGRPAPPPHLPAGRGPVSG